MSEAIKALEEYRDRLISEAAMSAKDVDEAIRLLTEWNSK